MDCRHQKRQRWLARTRDFRFHLPFSPDVRRTEEKKGQSDI
ncbi:hypothetical protein TMEN_2065 [Trichophyton mentagrophytes]|nr:hypothetical protein TMEN_2065 [Trichophyton mentagrophytes]